MAIRHGGRELTPKEQKTKVMQWTGWSTERYNKEYDKLRNRVRAFERATGKTKGEINVADLLAKDARNRHYANYYREQYTPTNLYQAVSATPSISSGKQLTQRTTERVRATAKAHLSSQFHGLLNNSKYSQDVQNEINRLGGLEKISPADYEKILRKYGRLSTADRQAAEEYNKNRRDFREPPKKVES